MLRPLAWPPHEGSHRGNAIESMGTYVLEALAVDGGVEADGVLAGDNVRQGAAGLALSVVAGHFDAIRCGQYRLRQSRIARPGQRVLCRLEFGSPNRDPPELGTTRRKSPRGPQSLAQPVAAHALRLRINYEPRTVLCPAPAAPVRRRGLAAGVTLAHRAAGPPSTR